MLPISVFLIAKNEEKRIEKCLSSIASYGFEIVVVDTGSTDNTREIAAGFTPNVYSYEWCDDFSAARNFALAKINNNWAFMLDCDEWVEKIDIDELLYFMKAYPASVGAVKRNNYAHGTLNNTDNTERFFDRRKFGYKGIIHEQLSPKSGNDFPCLLLHTEIGHSGYDMGEDEAAAKAERNLSLLNKQLETEGPSPYIFYQLGKGSEIISDYENAYKYYGRGLEYDLDPELAYVQAMVVSYGNAMLKTDRADEALAFESIYNEFSSVCDFVYLMGQIYKSNGQYDKALEQFMKAVTFESSRLRGANSFLSYYEIAHILELAGEEDEARKFYAMCGDYAPTQSKASKECLILFDSNIFILHYIMEQYKNALEENGYDIFVFGLTDTGDEFNEMAGKLLDYYHRHEGNIKAAVTFNNRGFKMPANDGTSLWDIWGIPCINILVDHPMYYHEALIDAPAKSVVVCSDRRHVSYIERFYPNISKSVFIPTGGEEMISQDFEDMDNDKYLSLRPIDVLFVGSYKYHDEYRYDEFDELLMNHMIESPDDTFEEAVLSCLKNSSDNAGVVISDDALRELIESHKFVETNICAIYRIEIIRALLEKGINVTLCGDGWDKTDITSYNNLDLRPRTSFADALSLMSKSKIVLNQMAWFKDGGSERIINAMLQGAVAVTDCSRYLEENFTDGQNIVFFSLEDIDSLPEKIAGLTSSLFEIARAGYAVAKKAHTWEVRANELIHTLLK